MSFVLRSVVTFHRVQKWLNLHLEIIFSSNVKAHKNASTDVFSKHEILTEIFVMLETILYPHVVYTRL